MRSLAFLGHRVPVVWHELSYAPIRVGREAGQQVAQVGEGFYAVSLVAGGGDEVDGGGARLRSEPKKIQIFAAGGDGAYGLFGAVLVNVGVGAVV